MYRNRITASSRRIYGPSAKIQNARTINFYVSLCATEPPGSMVIHIVVLIVWKRHPNPTIRCRGVFLPVKRVLSVGPYVGRRWRPFRRFSTVACRNALYRNQLGIRTRQRWFRNVRFPTDAYGITILQFHSLRVRLRVTNNWVAHTPSLDGEKLKEKNPISDIGAMLRYRNAVVVKDFFFYWNCA